MAEKAWLSLVERQAVVFAGGPGIVASMSRPKRGRPAALGCLNTALEDELGPNLATVRLAWTRPTNRVRRGVGIDENADGPVRKSQPTGGIEPQGVALNHITSCEWAEELDSGGAITGDQVACPRCGAA